MKKIYAASVLIFSIVVSLKAQNISVNTTGASNTTNSIFEVLQPSTTSGDKSVFIRHSGATTTAYGLWVEMTGAVTNKYAIVVPITGGNVGIGITAPLGRLDIQGTTARTGTAPTTPSFYVTGTLSSGQTGPASGNIEFRHDNQTQGVGFGYNTIYQTGSNANQELNLLSRGTSPITLNAHAYSTGNVGIGTTAPGNKLEVYGPASNYPARVGSPDGYLLFGPANTGWSHFVTDRARFYFNTGGTFDTGNIGSYDEDLSLQTQGTTRITVLNSNGNVGIGTTTPGFKLHVPSGYIGTDYINTTDNSVASGITGVMIKAGDNYLRTGTAGGVKAFLNGNTNGWIENQYAGAQSANYWISGESRTGGWFRNSVSGTGLYNEANAAGIYSTGPQLMSTYNGSSFNIEGASNGAGNLRFQAANPYIVSSSYFVCPGGAYFNSGTVYTEAQLQARGGIHNDNGNVLTIAGGSDALNTTYFPYKVGINRSGVNANSFLDVKGIGYFGDEGACAINYRISVGWYSGCNPMIQPEINGWGYVGNPTYAFWRMYSYGFVNVSRRETKRNINSLDDNMYSYMMDDIDKMKPSLYKYNDETDVLDESDPSHYRPNFHLGFILDESPDYIQDNAFSGIDVYSLATLGIVGVKQNRKDIKEIKEQLGVGKSITFSDFGSEAMQTTEIWIYFSEEFKKNIIKANTHPVITVTPVNSNASLYISEITQAGFKIKNATLNQNPISINWIAMAKFIQGQDLSDSDTAAKTKISPDILNQLKVPETTKAQLYNYYKNLKPSLQGGGKQ